MTAATGIALAFAAMLCWGFGDFFIQKSARKIGDWESLFIITFFGSIILLPFAYKNIGRVFQSLDALYVLSACAIILTIAAILDLEALKEGKLAVVEPIWSFEIPAAAILAFFILGERLNFIQILVVIFLILGLGLISLKTKKISKKFFLEKGIAIAFLSAIIMGSANFFMGWSSRITDPVVTNLFVNIFMAIVTGIYIFSRGKVKKTIKDMNANKKVLLSMAVLDNVAWIAFAFSMSLAPIGIAVALSESYIILAISLGLAANKEKLKTHQKWGLAVSILAAMVLAAITA